jgi:hypothetical protein
MKDELRIRTFSHAPRVNGQLGARWFASNGSVAFVEEQPMAEKVQKRYSQVSRKEPQRSRDPEDRPVDENEEEIREKAMDKTLADSFPTSDPPSTIPDPGEEDSEAA